MYLSLNKWHLRLPQPPCASELWHPRKQLFPLYKIGKNLKWESNSTRHCCTLQGLPPTVWLRDSSSSPTASAAPGWDGKLQQEGLGTATGQSRLRPTMPCKLVSPLYNRCQLHTARAASTMALVPGSPSPTAAVDHPKAVWY